MNAALRPPVLAALAVFAFTPSTVSSAAPTDAQPLGTRPPAPGETVSAIQRDELSSRRAFELVRSLCDEAGPRLAGSPGDRATDTFSA
jgi:hypothetical protein